MEDEELAENEDVLRGLELIDVDLELIELDLIVVVPKVVVELDLACWTRTGRPPPTAAAGVGVLATDVVLDVVDDVVVI